MPALFYSAPPGEAPLLLAIGHEFVLGSYLGPPLAFWLGEVAFRLAGAFGLYALAQACVVVTYWAVFTLGRSIVGTRHAVLGRAADGRHRRLHGAEPGFGPAVMAAPLWALALLHYWRAVGEGRRGYWFLLALDLGLLLLASYVGLILIVLMIAVHLRQPRGRARLRNPEPWMAVLPLIIVVFPHLAWLWSGRELVVGGLTTPRQRRRRSVAGLWLACAAAQPSRLVLLVALGSGWPRRPQASARREIDRNPTERLARWFVYVFALAPAAIAVAFVFASGRLGPFDRVAPLVVLSGLAVVRWRATRWLLYRERLVSSAWLGLLVAPPALVVVGLRCCRGSLAPISQVAQPANSRRPLLRRQFPAPHRQAAGIRHRRRALAPLVALAARAGRMSISIGRRSAARGRAPPICKNTAACWCGRPTRNDARRRRR